MKNYLYKLSNETMLTHRYFLMRLLMTFFLFFPKSG